MYSGVLLSRSLIDRRTVPKCFGRRFSFSRFHLPRLLFALEPDAEIEGVAGLNALPEVEFKALSQLDWNPLGARALAIRPLDWKHGETDHFIYHFVHSYVATPISVEAEFHYRVIAQELGLATMPGASGKSHIYIFEKPEDWKLFQGNAHLEPWTGGIHSCGSLFVVRDPSYKFANNSLGHEIAHLILFVSTSGRCHAGWTKALPNMSRGWRGRVTSVPATTTRGRIRSPSRLTSSFRSRD